MVANPCKVNVKGTLQQWTPSSRCSSQESKPMHTLDKKSEFRNCCILSRTTLSGFYTAGKRSTPPENGPVLPNPIELALDVSPACPFSFFSLPHEELSSPELGHLLLLAGFPCGNSKDSARTPPAAPTHLAGHRLEALGCARKIDRTNLPRGKIHEGTRRSPNSGTSPTHLGTCFFNPANMLTPVPLFNPSPLLFNPPMSCLMSCLYKTLNVQTTLKANSITKRSIPCTSTLRLCLLQTHSFRFSTGKIIPVQIMCCLPDLVWLLTKVCVESHEGRNSDFNCSFKFRLDLRAKLISLLGWLTLVSSAT